MGFAALLLVLVLVYIATRVPPRTHAGETPPPPAETAPAAKPEIRVTPSQVDRLRTQAANSLGRASELTEVEPQEGLATAVLRDSALADLIFVRVGRFEMSSYETPNAAYARCVEAKACRPPVSRADLSDLAKRFHPVVGVSWKDADTFCGWIGGRLPTEADWKAAFGDVGDAGGAGDGPAPVTSGRPNRLGLYGLAGNVKEWVGAGRLVNGGTWESAPADSRSPEIGFRCARGR